MTAEQPTAAEIRKVRAWECVSNGHRWDIIAEYGRELPDYLLCRNCGREVGVGTEL